MKIIFMGTPEFAVPALKGIASSTQHDLLAVFTKEPKESGRGHKIQKSEVHLEAEKLKTQIFTPRTLKSPEITSLIKDLNPDIIVVAAYGHIIPKDILIIPKYGCINIHPSLLPRWRGAAPIERTILAGDSETAVCIMQMDEALDTGDVLSMKRVELDVRIDAKTLTKDLAALGAHLLLEILDHTPKTLHQKQPEEGVAYAAKLSKEETIINWHDPAIKIDRMIRAFNAWSGCCFNYNGEQIKIIEAMFDNEQICDTPGKVLDKQLTICCGQGVLKPLKLQRPGKKALSVQDFLNGTQIKPGTIL